jgi:CTP:molybdopterin cytidylyltransferase MocA
MAVLGLVLAAGGSTRMGRPKQLAELDGRPLLEHVLLALQDAPVDRVMVALGASADEVRARVDLRGAAPLVVQDWARGMGHVLASALAAAEGSGEPQGPEGSAGEPRGGAPVGRAPVGRVPADPPSAIVLLLGDQPLVSGRAVARLVEAWRAGAGPVVTAAYGGRPGHPKLFDHRLLPELLRLDGDAGARDLLAAHPEWVHPVEVGGLGIDADVDEEADLDRVGRLLASSANRRSR